MTATKYQIIIIVVWTFFFVRCRCAPHRSSRSLVSFLPLSRHVAVRHRGRSTQPRSILSSSRTLNATTIWPLFVSTHLLIASSLRDNHWPSSSGRQVQNATSEPEKGLYIHVYNNTFVTWATFRLFPLNAIDVSSPPFSPSATAMNRAYYCHFASPDILPIHI